MNHRRHEDEEAQLQAALLASLVVSTSATSATSEVWRVRNGDSHEENTAEDWLKYNSIIPNHGWFHIPIIMTMIGNMEL